MKHLIKLPKLNKSNTILFWTLVVLALLLVLIKNLMGIHFYLGFSDIPNVVGILIGVIGLLFAWWQVKSSKEYADEARTNYILDKIKEIQKDFDDKDRSQAEGIFEIKQNLVLLNTLLDNHLNNVIGHPGLIEEFYKIKGELLDYKAALGMATRVGEITFKLDKLQKDINNIKNRINHNH